MPMDYVAYEAELSTIVDTAATITTTRALYVGGGTADVTETSS